MYEVRANIPFGVDDTYDCEYSGEVHKTKEAAEAELKKARKHASESSEINYVYISEI